MMTRSARPPAPRTGAAAAVPQAAAQSDEARLESALTIDDLRRIAKRRTPKAAFDYTDGAAEEELSLARARQAFRDIEFHPTILRDVAKVDTGRTVLGDSVALPFGIAPTGFTRLMQTEGEIAGAHAAARAGIPFSLVDTGHVARSRTSRPQTRTAATGFSSTCGKTATGRWRWWSGPPSAGFDTLLVTVDVPVAGARLRDTRNGMSIPPTLTLRTVLDAVPHPRWWFDLLTTEPLSFASLDRWPGTVAEYLDTMFDPTVTFEDLAWIKSQWPNKLVVKGIQTLDDARAVVDLGVDGIVAVQPRRPPARPCAGAVPPACRPSRASSAVTTEILLDTGIMSGADIVAAIALGARFTLVGRAYLYGLMAGGEAGVDRAIEILSGRSPARCGCSA